MTTETPTHTETTIVETPDEDGNGVTREVIKEIHHHHEETRTMRGFIAGVVTTILAAALALGAFLLVSDSDDDGSIELEVPSVEADEIG